MRSSSSSDGSDDLNTKRPWTPTSQAVPDKICVSCRSSRAQQDCTGAWACLRCTFVNDPTLPTCELCQTPRTSSGGGCVCETAWGQGNSNAGACPTSDGDMYVLDVCGCRHNRAALEGSIGALEASLPQNVGALLAHICCPTQSCHQPLSRNDLCNLMHPAALKKMDGRICAAALREAAIQARRSSDNLQDFALVPLLCPMCPDAPEMPLLAATASLTLAELQAALRARSVERPPRRLSDAAAQLKGLCSNAAHVCLTCSTGISRLTGEIISTDSIKEPACGTAGASEAAAAEKDRCLRLCSLIFQLHCALTNDQRVVSEPHTWCL
ncbi:g7737 [Coccomyxa elongata]